MISLILSLLFCLLIGFLARLLMPGPQHLSIGATLLLGVVGGLVARGFFAVLGVEGNAGVIASVLGACLVIWLVNWLRKKGLM